MAAPNYKKVKKDLEKVSASFCSAKWNQALLNLQTAEISSCCLTPAVKVGYEELKENADALLNPKELKDDRCQMIEGTKPASCEFCWKQEAQSSLESERIVKSASFWAQIPESSKELNEKSFLTYMEVSFSNLCNLKCSYCSPLASSSIMGEVLKEGYYPDSYGVIHSESTQELKKRISTNSQKNIYVEHFWKWMDKNFNQLEVLRVSGGEPLIEPQVNTVFEFLAKTQKEKFNFQINTNLMVSQKRIDLLIDQVNTLPSNYKVTLITSLDTSAEKAEYIRYGLDIDLFKKNLEYIIDKLPQCEIRVTSTISILAIYGFKSFIDYFLSLKNKIQEYDKLLISFYPVIKPECMSLIIANEHMKQALNENLKYLIDHKISPSTPYGFNEYEIDSYEKIVIFANSDQSDHSSLKKGFYYFYKEYDRRKGTDLLKTFPELKEFWNECKIIAEDKQQQLLTQLEHTEDESVLKKIFHTLVGEYRFYDKKNLRASLVKNKCFKGQKETIEESFWNLLFFAQDNILIYQIVQCSHLFLDKDYIQKNMILCFSRFVDKAKESKINGLPSVSDEFFKDTLLENKDLVVLTDQMELDTFFIRTLSNIKTKWDSEEQKFYFIQKVVQQQRSCDHSELVYALKEIFQKWEGFDDFIIYFFTHLDSLDKTNIKLIHKIIVCLGSVKTRWNSEDQRFYFIQKAVQQQRSYDDFDLVYNLKEVFQKWDRLDDFFIYFLTHLDSLDKTNVKLIHEIIVCLKNKKSKMSDLLIKHFYQSESLDEWIDMVQCVEDIAFLEPSFKQVSGAFTHSDIAPLKALAMVDLLLSFKREDDQLWEIFLTYYYRFFDSYPQLVFQVLMRLESKAEEVLKLIDKENEQIQGRKKLFVYGSILKTCFINIKDQTVFNKYIKLIEDKSSNRFIKGYLSDYSKRLADDSHLKNKINSFLKAY